MDATASSVGVFMQNGNGCHSPARYRRQGKFGYAQGFNGAAPRGRGVIYLGGSSYTRFELHGAAPAGAVLKEVHHHAQAARVGESLRSTIAFAGCVQRCRLHEELTSGAEPVCPALIRDEREGKTSRPASRSKPSPTTARLTDIPVPESSFVAFFTFRPEYAPVGQRLSCQDDCGIPIKMPH